MSLGRSSMVISLPKNWMQLNELKKGDVVSYAIQRDRSLVVYPRAETKATSKEITLRIGQNEDEALITQKIIGPFLNGYSGITLISEKIFSIPQSKAIRNVAGRLYMRIMESNSQGIYLQNLTDESKASLEQAIQRMHLISQSMCEDVCTAFMNRDVALAKSVCSLDDDVDHFCFFLIRLLRKAAQDAALANKLRIDTLDCMDHQTLVYRIEHTADYTTDIARQIIMLNETQQKIPDVVLDLLVTAGRETCNLYVKAVNSFFSKNASLSVEIMREKYRIEKLDQEIKSKVFAVEQKKAELVCAICSIRENIKRIADCAANIAEIAINRAFMVST
jgi:phosphate uptake regulator